jgi:hypothetical protein
MSEEVSPDRDRHPLDVAVFDLVVRAVEAVGGNAVALVTQTWGEGAGMLFTQAAPMHPEAAFLSVAYQDDSTLNLTVGHIWFEIFGPVEDNLDYLRSIVEAVVAGRVEQVGPVNNAAGRITRGRGLSASARCCSHGRGSGGSVGSTPRSTACRCRS